MRSIHGRIPRILRAVTPSAGDRFFALTGAANARDLGGLPAAGGRRTRRGRILRGDFLLTLTEADERLLLRELGLRTVVDLRTEAETERMPGPWVDREVELVRAALPVDPAFLAHTREEMVDLYLSLLGTASRGMAVAVERAIDPAAQPVFIHCAAGKDRTGVLVALLLGLAGVERRVIVADYVLTQERMEAVLTRLRAEVWRRPRDLPPAMFAAEPETIELFLDALDERYGGAPGWARERGISSARIERFRAAFLAGPSDGGQDGS